MNEERLALDRDRIAFLEDRDAAKAAARAQAAKAATAKAETAKRSTKPTPEETAEPARATTSAEVVHGSRPLPHSTAMKPSVRSSTTSSALQTILAAGSDTPPAPRPVLSPGRHNAQLLIRGSGTAPIAKKPAASDSTALLQNPKTILKNATILPPSSAALAARDRVQKAVQAAKARKVPVLS